MKHAWPLLLLACGDVSAIDWRFNIEVEGVVRLEAYVFRDDCAGAPIYEARFDRDGVAGEPPVLSDGSYCFEVRAIDEVCAVVGVGQVVRELPSMDPVVVSVRAAASTPACAAADTCVDGLCVTPRAGACDGCCPTDACQGGRCTPRDPVVSIAAGRAHTCAVRGGDLWCWGSSEGNGEVGTGEAVAQVAVPVRVGDADENFERVASRFRSTCAIADGRLVCFGLDADDQLGLGPDFGASVLSPTAQSNPGIDFEQVSMGHFSGCGLARDRALYCWGYNGQGQAGPSAAATVPRPERIDGREWDAFSVGRRFVCAVRNAQLFCWGQAVYGELGAGVVETESRLPRQVVGEWRTVSAGANHACAIDTSGQLFCWGHGDATDRLGTGEDVDARGALGLDAIDRRAEPSAVDLFEVASVAAWNHTCAVHDRGRLSCFGPNVHGELGTGDRSLRRRPTRVAPSVTWRRVAAGQDHSCAVDVSGALWCWGRNDLGALGTGDRIDRDTPTRVCF